jgi:transposase, IS30 family
MGARYNHLTRDERIQIRVLLQGGNSKKYIAEFLGRNYSTVKREISRNSGLRGYRPKQAQGLAAERRKIARAIKMTPDVIAFIEEKIGDEFSPEQISGVMKKEVGVKISIERIYQYLWRDKADGGILYKKLRIAGKRKRRKRYGKGASKVRIPERISIEERPQIVEDKKRFGDWEADLMSGSHHRGFLVTLVERKGKKTRIGSVNMKTKELVTAEIIRLLKHEIVHTITYDNGREFAGHIAINEALGCSSYFANPYCSWERGLNENTNGLIRQYFPKGMNLRDACVLQILQVEDKLNNRPRKTLDFLTPNEVAYKHVS